MKPYYNHAGITIYHGDCREIAPSVLADTLPILVLDPPFDEWANVVLLRATTTIAFTSPQRRHETEVAIGRPRSELVWYFRDGRWVSHKLPRITHGYIYVYGETSDAFVGDANPRSGEVIPKGRGSVGRDKLPERNYIPRDRKQLDSVLCYPRNVSGVLGVWSKPVALMVTLLEWVGSQEMVVDPYCGSGTTLVAARKLGRRAIGIEIDERSCEIAAKRLSQQIIELGCELNSGE